MPDWKVYNPDNELIGEGKSLKLAVQDAMVNAVIRRKSIEEHLFGPVYMAPRIPQDPADT